MKYKEELKKIKIEYRELEQKLRNLEERAYVIKCKVVATKANISPDLVFIGDWECSKSPIGVCAYNDWVDPYHDNCLFCGEPDERK